MVDVVKRDKPGSIIWATPFAKLKEDIKGEFDKWKGSSYKKVLTPTTYHSLPKLKGHYDMIILDECQKVTENNVRGLLSGDLTCNTLVLMTGTKSKDFVKHEIYRKLNLTLVYDYTIQEAVDDGVVSDFNLTVHMVSMGRKKDIERVNKKTGKTFNISEVMNYEYKSEMVRKAIFGDWPNKTWVITSRMRSIYDSPSKEAIARVLLSTLPGKKLIFTSSIKQCERLTDHNYHSKKGHKKDLELFQENEIDTLGLVNAGSIGFTYKGIKNLIIVQVDSNKNGGTVQKIFRSLLKQGRYKANIHILCLKDTQDEKWLQSCLEDLGEVTPEIKHYA